MRQTAGSLPVDSRVDTAKQFRFSPIDTHETPGQGFQAGRFVFSSLNANQLCRLHPHADGSAGAVSHHKRTPGGAIPFKPTQRKLVLPAPFVSHHQPAGGPQDTCGVRLAEALPPRVPRFMPKACWTLAWRFNHAYFAIPGIGSRVANRTRGHKLAIAHGGCGEERPGFPNATDHRFLVPSMKSVACSTAFLKASLRSLIFSSCPDSR